MKHLTQWELDAILFLATAWIGLFISQIILYSRLKQGYIIEKINLDKLFTLEKEEYITRGSQSA